MDAEGLPALALSRPAEALQQADALLAGHPGPRDAAMAHQAAGIVLRDFGNIEESLRRLRAGLRCARAAHDPGLEADIRAAYGVALVMSGRTGPGLAQVGSAIEGADGVAAGRIHVRRAHIFMLLGRHGAMLEDARRATELLAGGDPVWEARAYNHRAIAHQALGATARADADFERAEDLFRRAGQDLEYASARHDRAGAAFARGDLPAALALLDDARQIVDRLGVFEPDLAVTRTQVLLAAGLARDAQQVADAAVGRSREQGTADARHGELLLIAALAAHASGDLPTAITHGQAALTMFRRQRREWWAARAELTVLRCRFDAGEHDRPLATRAGALAARLEDLDATRAAEAHLLAGRLALAAGRLAKARPHLLAAAAGSGPDLRARTAAWLARAMLAEAEGRTSAMLTACSRGLQLVDLHLRTLGATELRAWATGQGSELSARALRHAVGTGDPRRVLEWSERWRAISLSVPPLSGGEDPDLLGDLSALRTLTRSIDDREDRTGAPGTLVQERRRLEDAVRRRALRTPGARAGRAAALRVPALREALGAATLVELAEVDGQLHAVVLPGAGSAGGRTRLVTVGPSAAAGRALDHALFALRREASRRGTHRLDLDELGRRLQGFLLGPAVPLLGDGPCVLVPTGRLHAVPWALMPALHDRAFTVAPSASAWLRGYRAEPPEPRRVVLVGGPGLSTGAEEVRRLGQLYPDAEVLTGPAATCERVLRAIDGAWLVHVAAHGTFRADSPLFSALELADGPLTVYDLERLGRAPHRVVLSSCDSAVGAPTGADELLGVVSALISLGSAGVVASVVPVDDPSTVPFMTAFHRALPGRTLGAALAAARLAAGGPDPQVRCTADSFVALGA